MDIFSYQDYILPHSTLKTTSQPFGHGISEFSLTHHAPTHEKDFVKLSDGNIVLFKGVRCRLFTARHSPFCKETAFHEAMHHSIAYIRKLCHIFAF